jgi:hypothetical protein
MRRHVRVFTAPVARISNSVKRRSGERVAWVSPEKLPDLSAGPGAECLWGDRPGVAGRTAPAADGVIPGGTEAASPAIARAMIASFLSSPDKARTRSLIAAISCAALAGCGFGLLMPLVALNLEAMTGSAAVVGANAAAAALSTLLATPLIPALMARTAPRQTVIICAMITAAGFVLFPAMPDPVIWFGLRFVMGLSVTIIFVASETWINQLAKPESRASLLAVYATVLAGGFGSGGLLLVGARVARLDALDRGRGDLRARRPADHDLARPAHHAALPGGVRAQGAACRRPGWRPWPCWRDWCSEASRPMSSR